MVGDLVELRMVIQHIDHFRTVGLGFELLTDSPDAWQELGEEWAETVAPTWVTTMNFQAQIRRVEIYPVVGEGPDLLRIFLNPRPHGTDVLQVAPHQCAALIRWTTGLAGRSNRGRSYLWVFSVYHVPNGWQLGDELLARMQAVVDCMLAQYGPSGASSIARFVIISRSLDGVRRATPIGIPVTGGVPVDLLATQRSRLTRGTGGG